jgi:hypothetical protein
LAGVALALITGALWALVRTIPFVGFFNFIIGGFVGYVIGEGISLACNKKSGNGLAAIGGICVVLSYLVTVFAPWGRPLFLTDIIALIIGIVVCVSRLR